MNKEIVDVVIVILTNCPTAVCDECCTDFIQSYDGCPICQCNNGFSAREPCNSIAECQSGAVKCENYVCFYPIYNNNNNNNNNNNLFPYNNYNNNNNNYNPYDNSQKTNYIKPESWIQSNGGLTSNQNGAKQPFPNFPWFPILGKRK